jgi:hypothetical protein
VIAVTTVATSSKFAPAVHDGHGGCGGAGGVSLAHGAPDAVDAEYAAIVGTPLDDTVGEENQPFADRQS